MRDIIVGMSGASGAIYGRRLLERLARMDVRVHLVVSDAFRRVLKEEEGITVGGGASGLGRLWRGGRRRIVRYDIGDIGCRIASGSFPTDGMAIIPCSLGRVGSIAAGIARDLMDRAAAVCLKEGRRLVLVPRETPLGLIPLENMARLARAGAVILPAAPGFYGKPKTILDLADFIVDRVMAQLRA